ncbi:ATP-binding cassette domain-containing protein [Catellatospora coxensis]
MLREEVHVPTPLLALDGVSKSFGAVAALRDVRLELHAGEAHALVGENGAGKSTLVKILAGVHAPDAGTVTLDGRPLLLSGPADARAAGIAVIYQEPTLFADLSVAENIFMGRQPLRSLRRVDYAAMRERAAELFARLGVRLDPDRPARGLSIADQQLVEIAKAISSTRGSWSWTSRPQPCPGSRSSGCSPSPGRCATPAPRCCSSRTASTRSSPCARPSPSCATAGGSPPTPPAR